MSLFIKHKASYQNPQKVSSFRAKFLSIERNFRLIFGIRNSKQKKDKYYAAEWKYPQYGMCVCFPSFICFIFINYLRPKNLELTNFGVVFHQGYDWGKIQRQQELPSTQTFKLYLLSCSKSTCFSTGAENANRICKNGGNPRLDICWLSPQNSPYPFPSNL